MTKGHFGHHVAKGQVLKHPPPPPLHVPALWVSLNHLCTWRTRFPGFLHRPLATGRGSYLHQTTLVSRYWPSRIWGCSSHNIFTNLDDSHTHESVDIYPNTLTQVRSPMNLRTWSMKNRKWPVCVWCVCVCVRVRVRVCVFAMTQKARFEQNLCLKDSIQKHNISARYTFTTDFNQLINQLIN